MASRWFGEIEGVPDGTAWLTRALAAAAGVHRPLQAGISGSAADGADSIVVSGGYEDDLDYGDEIIYTGAGGNDPGSGRQIADQELARGNAGLVTSQFDGLPVRVVRGAGGDPNYSPAVGYRYDGLFRVADHWSEQGLSGFRVWRYRLVRLDDGERPAIEAHITLPHGTERPRRYTGVTTRVARSTPVAEAVKRLYRDACQVCGITLSAPGGTIAEGAHIRALGTPHNGPDQPDNILCLCPNHHTLLDEGGLWISDDLQISSHDSTTCGTLNRHPRHAVNSTHLRYHRELWNHGP